MPAKKSAPSVNTVPTNTSANSGVRVAHAALVAMKGGKSVQRPVAQKSVNKQVPTNLHTSVKKKRFRPGTVALRQIRKQQRRTDLIFARTAFHRIMLRCSDNLTTKSEFPNGVRMQFAARVGLQSAIEAQLTETLEKSNLLAIHGGRVTVQPKDIQMARRVMDEVDKLKF